MIQKQNINLNFAQGLDTKTDPWQLPFGKFLKLDNAVFDKGGLLKKRNGFGKLASLPDASNTFLTTFNNDLTAIGSSISAYSPQNELWINKGTLQPMQVSTLALIRNNTNQSWADSAVDNNLVCTGYVDQDETSLSTLQPKYVVADVITGQNLIAPTVIANADPVFGAPRVFSLGNNFLVIYARFTGGVYHLEYIAINKLTFVVNPPVAFAINYLPTPLPNNTLAFDGYVFNNSLYLAWNTSTVSVEITSINNLLVQSATVAFLGEIATTISVTVDSVFNTIWVTYYDNVSQVGRTFAFGISLGTVLVPTTWISAVAIANVATIANNFVNTIYYEIINAYSYDASIPTNYIDTNTVSQSGFVGTASTLIRSVGLASKAFSINGSYYFLSAYESPYQPSYFLINQTGGVVAKLAYSNGGGYLPIGLPNASIIGSTAYIPYLYKDLIEAVNKNQQVKGSVINGIYSQTGINLASINITTGLINTSEIGKDLHVSGGFLWMYDGYSPVEHLFHLWPDSVELTESATGGGMAPLVYGGVTPVDYYYQVTYEWTDNQGNAFRSAPSIAVHKEIPVAAPISFTASFLINSDTLTVSSATGLFVGQNLTDITTPGNLLADTFITSIVGTTVTINTLTQGAAGGDTIHTVDQGSITLDIPLLRLTYKTANPVKIVIYRWSTQQQEYYQVTSIDQPILNLNILSSDSISYTDTSSDAVILGNNLIYTTGGVVENVAGPATINTFLFDDRLWLIDAEDRNLLWYSKQVVESTPAETSDLFTLYVAPTISAQGSTGQLTCGFPMDDKAILFKSNAINYINGTGPDNTGANSQYSQPIFITGTVGCSNANSIVLIPNGLMFQSSKGIWLLGRDLQTSYIGAPVEQYNSNVVTSAVNIPNENQVRFTLDNGLVLMYDYYYNQWGTFSNISALSSTIYQKQHSYIDAIGNVLQETPGAYLDAGNAVTMGFTTSWINPAGLQGYVRSYFFLLIGQYISPHKLNLSIAYNYNPSPEQSNLITPDNYSQNYGVDSPYGQGSPYGGNSSVEQWRVFLSKQRCQSFQISLQEIYDPTLGVAAGAGLTLSGLNLIYGVKKGWRPMAAANTVGGS